MKQTMIRAALVAIAAVAVACLPDPTKAADKAVAPAAAPVVTVVQDCSVFYDDYHARGFTWGSGPGLSVGFGTFEGALPRYVPNSFPNWYGACRNWGNYSSAGSAIGR